ncbi:TlpA family protein disulfide reductase [Arachidicoccus sp.]|uniref:TlpA family protein disulfide reductase n=1 Tax=Arachidicoccus sp. TaxID=1872624 RepID=UPI003D1C253D
MKSSISPERAKLCLRDSVRQIKSINKSLTKKLLCFLGGTLLLSSVQAQQKIEPFFIGDRIPDLPLHRIINYKNSTATLSSFGDKLIILDFWSIHCSSCIEQFPQEDSLQHILGDKLQFILLTLDPKEKVTSFLKHFDSSHHTKFSLPIIYSDSTICCLFRHHAVPHYVWLAPNGAFLAQTEQQFITPQIVEQVSNRVVGLQKQMRKEHFSEVMLTYPPPGKKLIEVIRQNKILIDNIR